MDKHTQNLKDMIHRMIELDGGLEKGKQQLDEMASMNVSMSGETADEVASLMKILQNAGMNDPEPAGDAALPARQDMERLAGIMGDPEPVTTIAPGPGTEELEEWSSQDADTLALLMNWVQSAAKGNSRDGAKFEDYIDNNFPNVNSEELIAKLVKMDNDQQFDALHQLISSEYRNDADDDYTDQSMRRGEMGMEGYDNEPDEEYQDTDYMTKDLSGGLNRQKKQYAKAQDGDNAMAVESIKDRLYARLLDKKSEE